VLRTVAVATAVGVVWTAAAGRVAGEIRLPAHAVVRGAPIVQAFGCTSFELEPFDPYCPSKHFHSGIDIAAAYGTAIYSATGGRVRLGYDEHGAGLFVSVAFDDKVRILYCHLHSTAVSQGEHVSAGELLGEVGSSGLSTGPHLHLEVQVDGRAVDPIGWLAG
jgi:murein DD-endopeptidase MepM/ murein hydrolase activator NlpD